MIYYIYSHVKFDPSPLKTHPTPGDYDLNNFEFTLPENAFLQV